MDNVNMDPNTASLGNQVWLDANGNGLLDASEVGVANVTVILTGAGNDGILGTADDTTTIGATNSLGYYNFTGLAAGDYTVTFADLPAGLEFTTQNAGSIFFDSDPDPATGVTNVISLEAGKEERRIDAGLVTRPDPQTASIGNKVWFDTNGNGLYEQSEESGVPYSSVHLAGAGADYIFGTADDISATGTTDGDGNYIFTGLAAGLYKVTFDLPNGYEFTTQNAGRIFFDSDADPETGMTGIIDLAPGKEERRIDAGIVEFEDPLTASIGNKVWFDTNGNGLFEQSEESGVPFATVNLSGAGADSIFGTADDISATGTTDGDGNYNFTGLAAGLYKVTFDIPDGYEFTTQNAGSEFFDSDADPVTGMTDIIDLAAGQEERRVDAGIVEIEDPLTASIGNKVWFDTNGNGLFEQMEEGGVPNVTVTLTGAGDDGVLGTADDTTVTGTTDSNGNYGFTGLAAGDYKVTFSDLPEGYEFTEQNAGSEFFDSDADPVTGMTDVVSLAPGQDERRVDAGLISRNASIDIEKFTNGVDADTADAAAQIVAGETVIWTYEITNDGDVAFDQSEITVTDDQEGAVTTIINQGDGNHVLAPGETWVYQTQGVAQNLGVDETHTLSLVGHSAFDGTDGNIRTFVSGDLSVNASAFSRDKHGQWSDAFLGAFSGGLGVTDSSEGSGHCGLHRVDNVYRDNFILFEFSENVVVDKALLAAVGADSDITYWVGTVDNPIDSHNVLSDTFLNDLVFTEDNNGGSYSRWADINSGNVSGNILVIAASVSDTTPEDRFKLKSLEVQTVDSGVYQNLGTVQAGEAQDSDLSHYVNEVANPSLDIEKFTNGVDADTADTAVAIAAGEQVIWTYAVTNDGNVSFHKGDIAVNDDQEGAVTHIVDQGNGDNILSPGEMWVYQKQGIAQDLQNSGVSQTFSLVGYNELDGADGNIRTFKAGDLSVNASAFNRNSHGQWSSAYLGAFSSGLGVTNRNEGNGSHGLHRLDNVGSHDYILFEFSEAVVVDETLLASVGADSDITYWVGNSDDPFLNHNSLSDNYLNSLDFTEDNNGGSYSRWADINSGELAGNVLVIAASTSDTTPEDRFKIKALDVKTVESGIYQNTGSVQALGAHDSDLSHYINASAQDPLPVLHIS